MLALFGRRIVGQCPVAPSSPGPFVLLLIFRDGPDPVSSEERGFLENGWNC